MIEKKETGLIQVPRYFADVFNCKLSTQDQASERIFVMGKRVHLLIDKALENLPNSDWIISGTEYHSKLINEPYGFESDGVMTYIFAEERGKKSPIAIFKDDHLAAKYFVWLVSKGQRKIDWKLFLDMVP